jgi:hypothetical protein
MITGATFVKAEQLDAVSYRVTLHLVDDTLPAYDQGFVVRGVTLVDLRDDATRQIVALNQSLTTKNVLAGIANGTPIPVTLATVNPTAQQIFFADLARWNRVKAAIDSGILVGTEAEVAALKAQVKSEYQATFLAGF